MSVKNSSTELKNKHSSQRIIAALGQVLILAFSFIALLSPITAKADIPSTIGYQGLLKDSDGAALTGTYNFTFRIYANSSGGSAIWSETQTGISVSNGSFAVRLGSATAFPASLDFNQSLFISTEVGSDGEMSPRITINSVPYAYTSGGINALPSAPVSATGGRMYYDMTDGGLRYFDALTSAWTLLGVSTGTLQSVTNAGNVTTNAIQFAGGTSTGDFVFSGGVTSTNLYATTANFANLSATTINSGTLGNSGVTLNLSGFGTVTGTITADHTTLLTTLSDPFTLQEALDFYNSNDVLDGGIITSSASGTIDVSGGQGFIRVSATDNGSNSILTSWATTTGISIPSFRTWLNVYAYYNGGSPVVVVTSTDLGTNYQYTKLGIVNNNGVGELDISDRRVLHRDTRGRLGSFFSANAAHVVSSGCTPSATGTRQLYISTCVSWNGINRVDTAAHEASDNMVASYRDGLGGYIDLGSQTQWNNLYYDDGTGVLVALGAGEYGVHWVYVHEDGSPREVHLLYGRASYTTVDEALAATAPATFPTDFNGGDHVLLLAKMVFAQAASTPTQFVDYRPLLVNNGSGTSGAGSSGVTNHNDLSGLQGGAAGEFYHLTASGFNAAGELHLSANAGGLFTLRNNAATNTKIAVDNTGAGTASFDIVGGDLQLASTTRITNAGFGYFTGLDVAGGLTVSSSTSLAEFTFTIATGTSVTSTNLFATNAQFTNLVAQGAILTNATTTSVTSTNIYATNGGFAALQSGALTVTGATDVQGLTFVHGTSSNWLGFAAASGTSLSVANTFLVGTTTQDVSGQYLAQIEANTNTPKGLKIANYSSGTAATAVARFYTDQGLTGSVFANSSEFSTFPNATSSFGIAALGTATLRVSTNGGNMRFTTLASDPDPDMFIIGSGPLRGNVGIGTQSPTSKLTVIGGMLAEDIVITNSTSTYATTTYMAVTGSARLSADTLINGVAVCLDDGTNCPSSASADFQTVTNNGSTTTHDIQFAGGTSTRAFTIQNNLTVTGATDMQGLTFVHGTSSNWLGFAAASGTRLSIANSLLIGTSTQDTSSNYMHQIEANSVTPSGLKIANYNAGTGAAAVARFYTDQGLTGSVFAASSNFTTFPNATSSFGIAAQGSARLRISTNGGDMRFTTLASDPDPDLFIVGSGSLRGNVGIGTQNPTSKLTVIGGMLAEDIVITHSTSTYATTTHMAVTGSARLSADTLINGVAVCLDDGTNCPTSASADFQTVTNNGNTTTRDIQFAGGTSTRAFTVQNNLTVTGTTALQALSFTNATGVYIDLAVTSTTPTAVEGRLYFDSAKKALAYFTDNGISATHIGQETFLRVRNSSGSDLTRGQVVRVTGADGGGLATVDLALADAVATVNAIGILDQDIANGGAGNVIVQGTVDDLDTSSFTAGDAIFLSAGTSGTYTNIRPLTPNITLEIGVITKSSATSGQLLVHFITPKFGAITTGAVTFGDTNNFITNDPTNLFWDNSLNRFGLGTNAPSSTLHVVGSTQMQDLVFTIATGTSATTTNLFTTNGTVTNLIASSVTVTGGTINGVTIGMTTPALAIFTDATSTNFVGTNVTSTNFVSLTSARLPANTLINGVAVCLDDGTNCPSSASADFQTVTNNGSTTTHDIQFAGGTSTRAFTIQNNLTVTGTLAVTGSSTFENMTLAEATATSVTTTNFFATNGTFGNLSATNQTTLGGLTWVNATGTNTTSTNFFATLASISLLSFGNGTSTSWLGFTTASGTTLNATSAFANGLTWTNATGANTTSTYAYATTLQAGTARINGALTMAGATQQNIGMWTSSTIPATNIESVRSLMVFNGYLYAGQGDSSGDGDVQICDPSGGGDVALCDNAADWTASLDNPVGVTRVSAMMEYNSRLYAGFTSTSNAGISYCEPTTTGVATKCEAGDWVLSTSTIATEIRAFAFYNGYFYAANDTTVAGSASVLVCNPAAAGNVQICDNTADWANVALPVATTYEEAPALVVYLNRLYAGVGNGGNDNDLFVCNPTGGGNLEMCDNAADWTRSVNVGAGALNTIDSAAVYDGRMYFGMGDTIAGSGGVVQRCDVAVSGDTVLCDATTELSTVVAAAGTLTRTPALMSFDGVLMIGREGTTAGDGSIMEYRESYATTTDAGFGIFEATYAFTNYNGVLYAGRGNSAGDGQVWYYKRARNASNVIQFETASSTGSLWFSQESLSTLGTGQPGDVTAGAFKFSHGIITEAGAYDLAEMYPMAETGIEAGDVVAMSPTASGAVERSSKAYDPRAFGVVSTKPGFLLSSTQKEGVIPVALAGRVPVKFSTENGTVQIGDALTAASTTGYAMKATRPGVMVGRALQAFGSADTSSTNAMTTGTIMMVVQTGYYLPTDDASDLAVFNPNASSTADALQGAASTPEIGLPSGSQISQGLGVVTLIVRDATFTGNVVIYGPTSLRGPIILGSSNAGSVDIAPRTDRIAVAFTSPFQMTPHVFVSFQVIDKSDGLGYDSALWTGDYFLTDVTTTGFGIRFPQGGYCPTLDPCPIAVSMDWFTVGFEDDGHVSTTEAVPEGNVVVDEGQVTSTGQVIVDETPVEANVVVEEPTVAEELSVEEPAPVTEPDILPDTLTTTGIETAPAEATIEPPVVDTPPSETETAPVIEPAL